MNGGDGVAFCSNNLNNYNRQEAIREATKLYDINQHPIKDKSKKLEGSMALYFGL